jgi:alpha-L-rhamnosidase
LNAARLLNQTADVSDYSGLLEKIKTAFRKEYLTPSGRLVSSTQTAYVLALNFDMLPDSLRPQAAKRLVDNIKSYDYHLTTGFLGTPYLCHVLTRFGYTDIAYKLLLQETYPSWLYPVKMGATTIWERWDGQKPDSSFQTPGMNSFNHYSYGAIGDWLYRDMAGLDTDEESAGYKHVKIMPHTGGGFTAAAASLETYYGKLSSGWTVEKNKTVYTIEIPANTDATICLPAANTGMVSESGKPVTEIPQIKITSSANGLVILELGSGTYHFTVVE